MIWYALGGILSLVGFIFAIMIVVHAFQKGGTGPGLMCIFVPFYIFYWAFAKYDHPKKGLHIGGWLGGSVIGMVLIYVGVINTAKSIIDLGLRGGIIQRGVMGVDKELRRGLEDLSRGLRDLRIGPPPSEPPRADQPR